MRNTTFSKNNKVDLVRNGADFTLINLDLISEAKYFIWLHTYIFDFDEITKPIIDALILKAQEGVKVYILLDGFGSRFFKNHHIDHLTNNGVEFNWFAPLFSTKMHHIGRRLHSKILLVDNKKVLTGGINHSKKFCAPKSERPWLDYSVLLEGDRVLEITKRYLKLYSKHFKSIKNNKLYFLNNPEIYLKNNCHVRIIENDWMRFKNEIYKFHLDEVRHAKKSIKILATYFFPGKKFLEELKLASLSGVEVILIFTKRSDHPVERWSSKYLYSWFISQNFKIYEWEESIVHGKILFFDDQLCSIGSYNHNFMGHYGNIELNIDVFDSEFSKEIKSEFDYLISKSKLISKEGLANTHHFKHKVLETLSFVFANILTFISLWFVIRKNDDDET